MSSISQAIKTKLIFFIHNLSFILTMDYSINTSILLAKSFIFYVAIRYLIFLSLYQLSVMIISICLIYFYLKICLSLNNFFNTYS